MTKTEEIRQTRNDDDDNDDDDDDARETKIALIYLTAVVLLKIMWMKGMRMKEHS